MKKNWILLAEYSYGTCAWDETSTLYWCGGETYAIVFERSAMNAPRQEEVFLYTRDEIKEAWEHEQASYDYYLA